MDYTIIRSSRRSLALQVKADGTVIVRAPKLISRREIDRFVTAHRDWIDAQLAKRVPANPLSDAELRTITAAAREDLTRRCSYWAGRIGVTWSRISIRHQRSKWGSCSAQGNLNFNCLLMLAPEPVRDYVVVHELCHRRYMNHSKAFWNEVARVYPDYEAARRWLKEHGEELMARNPAG